MCFSAAASFTAAGALGVAGVFSLRQARAWSQVPLAAIPMLFAGQQAVEGVVWSSANQPGLQGAAALGFVLFSHVVWPTFLPAAVLAAEPDQRRTNLLKGVFVVGASLSGWIATHILSGPVTATLMHHGVVYRTNEPDLPAGLGVYLFATCVGCFVSSHRYVRLFGVALFLSLGIALWCYREAFYSVWCFFSAILSVILLAHLRQVASQDQALSTLKIL